MLLTSLSGCSGYRATVKEDKQSLWCPEEGLAPPPEKPGPVPADFKKFKLWVGELLSKYAALENQSSILRQCWERESAKRE